MQLANDPAKIIVRHADPRFSIEIPANLVVREGDPISVSLVNLSRHGFRVRLDHRFAAGEQVRLEVSGWPRLAGHVIWSQDGRTGCTFDDPPSPKMFTMMCNLTTAVDREAF